MPARLLPLCAFLWRRETCESADVLPKDFDAFALHRSFDEERALAKPRDHLKVGTFGGKAQSHVARMVAISRIRVPHT